MIGQSPCAAWMSVWHSPEVSILTRISPGSGTGIGTASMLSGWLKSRTTAACIVPTRSKRSAAGTAAVSCVFCIAMNDGSPEPLAIG